MTQVTFVKKKLENGDWCAKCNDVSARLEKDGTAGFIDRTVIADLNDPKSEGIQLAEQYSIDRAPFFVVKDPATDSVEVFDVYFKFKRHMERATKTA